MKRVRYYHSKNLPKFTFGFYQIFKKLGITTSEDEDLFHEKISPIVKEEVLENIEKYFGKYNLVWGKDVTLDCDVVFPENINKALSNYFQVEARINILNTKKYLNNLGIKNICLRDEPFTMVIDNWGDYNLFEINPDSNINDHNLHLLEDYLNNFDSKVAFELSNMVLSSVPHLQYTNFLLKKYYPVYLESLSKIPDFYTLKSAYSNDCYLVAKSKEAKEDLELHLNKVSRLRLCKNLNKDLSDIKIKIKIKNIKL